MRLLSSPWPSRPLRGILFFTLWASLLTGCPDPVPEDSPTEQPTPTLRPGTPTPPLETPTLEPETPTLVPETPTVVPETPTLVPETPTVVPETPTLVPETPTLVPETPTLVPETPTLEPETPTLEPETPTLEPETPTLEPETPTLEPETPTPDPATLDHDGDGWSTLAGDCDDQEPGVYPSAVEEPYDGIDQDCSGSDLTDVDGDGYAGGAGPDCDDTQASIHPSAPETAYDGIDQDCSGQDLTDVDGDGYAGGTSGPDCDDLQAGVHPDAADTPYDGVDQDCSGMDLIDVDGDGYAGGASGSDCNDSQASIYPQAAEIPYDGIDQDCSSADLTDVDGDGVAGGPSGADCDDQDDTISPISEEIPYDGIDQDCSGADLEDQDQDGFPGGPEGSDCDDLSQATYPGAPEFDDDQDNDCDGKVDEGLNTTDDDLDGLSEAQGDCDDSDASISPAAEDVPYDGIDQDCSGLDLVDVDGDGFAAVAAGGTDCDDLTIETYPGAEDVINDGIDQDCSGSDRVDADGDGHASEATGGDDCQDDKSSVYPGAAEVCNGADDNCSGQADEGLTFTTWYLDADQDGYGVSGTTRSTCNGAPAGYVATAGDCDDGASSSYPGASELCDGKDNNCDGSIPTPETLNGAVGACCSTNSQCASSLECSSGSCALPQVTTGGLVLHLDAGNTTSYPGSGTTWKDLSGKGFHTTLTGTTFVAEFGGGLYMPQTGGVKATVPASPYWAASPSSAGNTLEFWWKKGSETSHGGSIIGTYPANGGTWQIFQNSVGYSTSEPKAMLLFANGSSPQYWWTGSSHNLNEVSLVTVVQRGTTFDFYKNGVYISSQTRSSFAETGSRVMTMGANSINTEVAAVTFYVVRWYNRQLSATEIARNFSVERQRFGK